MTKAMITLVVAMAENRAIGINNTLPWHLPEDLKHFKAVTLGKPVVMGRKTWDSIGRPLPGRRNIVVTRNADWAADGAEPAHSLGAALALAGDAEEICVIGGAELYGQAIESADRLLVTEVGLTVAGDAFFPVIDRSRWQETGRESHQREDGLVYAFVEYRRL
ncbi:dihydrofolate reductase [Crenobacter sp. SG2303]|uniref:Dihydrofolate reductase n=1 Tax=Crenobacter oryzisoli TaxID=3056844 RepID=A0ABT7XLD7_9NEIS|nr:MULTISPECIES: dihydrofolate reductase [unclassified Crenobacter]MDN0074594.1 dihydrofolate reductase [Crenobacter sp. SG2303]MDN0082589.1 dihydrofolate reductase [Crenobacter sp. SG2305]